VSDNITLPRAVAEEGRDPLAFMADEYGFTHKANRAERWQALAILNAALAEPEQKPEPDTITMPRAVAEFLLGGRKDIPAAPPEPDAKREPATVEQVIAAHGPSWGPSATPDFFTGFRAAERFHGITKEDK